MKKAGNQRFGLLGEHLGHSYSPAIHKELAEYDYQCYETAPDQLEAFLKTTELSGMNVTIPYKVAVMEHCASVSDVAARIGSVNTLVKTSEGWVGDNTDYYGFCGMLAHAGIEVRDQKVLVLGSGGASRAVCTASKDLGAADVVVISRSGADNYDNLERHRDASVIVNTTPVGMYPKTGTAPLSLADFPALQGVADIIYNPARTRLLLDAEKLGLPYANGLYMLVAQAKRSAELFTGETIPDSEVERITVLLEKQMQNIILIGMPGCGKSSIGRRLAERLGRRFVDADAALVDMTGKEIPAIFAGEGEDAFRTYETKTLEALGRESGLVIATGGGCVTREENYPLLHQNGEIWWIRRDLKKLPVEGRPLSQQNSLESMYEKRKPLYEAFADHLIDNSGSIRDAVRKIMTGEQG